MIRQFLSFIGGAFLYLTGRRQAKTETALQAAERHAKATESGRKAAAKAKVDLSKGMTPEEIVRRNDGRWND